MNPYGNVINGPAAWTEQAACVGYPDTVFFADNARHNPNVGKAICRSCPVRQRCLDEAIRAEAGTVARFGIFGGLTPSERARYIGIKP